MFQLYEHNRIAYESAMEMLQETGKAAVVHPTGTGKSFIGFKLCEDNPDKTVLWLSPSEYIFRTQLENLKAAGGEDPGNIRFLTYARLVNMDEQEMERIQPDFIVLDEFHRGGAEIWGAALQKLLAACAGVPVLGLSATAIRYLDNRRNMADELFDGCIASEMTLGEAIVRGILNPPRYVTAVYSYRKELEGYQKRIGGLRDHARRDRAEKLLEALRRTLEKADGLDVVFQKHMTDPHGKYLVFCANKEHMDEMMSHLEWFWLADESPRVYSVYSDDPAAGESFEAFKNDRNGDHLRLLYCIDALNEGIHVEGVNGVILLRPTVSPIIYKQQIGRALSAGKVREPVIFDIVNNFAGLYSIGAVQEEMEEFGQYDRLLGEPHAAVNERFQLIDAVENCRELFEELEDVLSSSWDFMYGEAEAYYRENSNLLPPRSYVTENGAKLGQWIIVQRINYRNGAGISPSRIERLNRIGMSWQTMHERQWEEKYRLALEYYAAHGDLLPTRGMNPGLAYWIVRQRQKQRDGLLPEEQFEKLSALGMVWEFEDAWEQKFEAAKAYLKEHGDLDIPATYETKDGVRLGAWYRGVRNQYRDGTLSRERREKMESIGAQWDAVAERTWMQYYELAREYYRECGDLNVNADYETPDGVKLGAWIAGQRYRRSKGHISGEQIRLLDEIGMSWRRYASQWDAAYGYAKAYFDEYGALNPPAEYRAEDGFALGSWVAGQRRRYAAGKLGSGQIRRLEALGVVWDVAGELWERGYEHAKAYYKTHGDLDAGGQYVAEDGYKLGAWLVNQRTRNRDGSMTEDRRSRLEELGMRWSLQKDRWQTGYEHLCAYCAQYGDADIPQRYVCGDGYALGRWVTSQRAAYREGKLSDGRVKLLESQGMAWNTVTDRWNRGYGYAKSYRTGGGAVPVPRGYVTADGYPLGEWMRSQERRFRRGVLEEDRLRQLAGIGIVFDGG